MYTEQYLEFSIIETIDMLKSFSNVDANLKTIFSHTKYTTPAVVLVF